MTFLEKEYEKLKSECLNLSKEEANRLHVDTFLIVRRFAKTQKDTFLISNTLMSSYLNRYAKDFNAVITKDVTEQ